MVVMTQWTDVVLLADFPPGAQRVVTLDNTAIVVFNLGADLAAIEDVCTHDYCPLSGGVVEAAAIVCPRHGARFDLKTGEALCAPAYEPVTVFPVRVEHGMVQVRDPRWD